MALNMIGNMIGSTNSKCRSARQVFMEEDQ